ASRFSAVLTDASGGDVDPGNRALPPPRLPQGLEPGAAALPGSVAVHGVGATAVGHNRRIAAAGQQTADGVGANLRTGVIRRGARARVAGDRDSTTDLVADEGQPGAVGRQRDAGVE